MPCLLQVIEATISKHKQNSQTFKAFSAAFSQDEDPSQTPEPPVSAQARGCAGGACVGMWLQDPVRSTLPSLRAGLASRREAAPIRSYPHAQGLGWWTADVCPLSTEYLRGPLCLQARWPQRGRSGRQRCGLLTVPTQDSWAWRWGQGCSHPLSLGGHLGLRHSLCLGFRVRLPTGCPEAAGCPAAWPAAPRPRRQVAPFSAAKVRPAGYLAIYLIFALNLLAFFCFLDYFERKRAGAELSTRTPEGGAGTRAAYCRADGQVQVWADPNAALDFGMWPSLHSANCLCSFQTTSAGFEEPAVAADSRVGAAGVSDPSRGRRCTLGSN